MSDFYLRAASEAEMTEALLKAGVAYLDEDVLVPFPGVSLDVIGKIVKFDMTDPEHPKPIEKEGWHVNLQANVDEDALEVLKPLEIVPPETPYRVWAS